MEELKKSDIHVQQRDSSVSELHDVYLNLNIMYSKPDWIKR